jgi:hypothetical protein
VFPKIILYQILTKLNVYGTGKEKAPIKGLLAYPLLMDMFSSGYDTFIARHICH